MGESHNDYKKDNKIANGENEKEQTSPLKSD
jgi:hypothetical protein